MKNIIMTQWYYNFQCCLKEKVKLPKATSQLYFDVWYPRWMTSMQEDIPLFFDNESCEILENINDNCMNTFVLKLKSKCLIDCSILDIDLSMYVL